MTCGVVVNPNYERLDLQLLKMRKKKAAEMMGRFLKRIKSMVQGGILCPRAGRMWSRIFWNMPTQA